MSSGLSSNLYSGLLRLSLYTDAASLNRLVEAGVCLKQSKYKFMRQSFEILNTCDLGERITERNTERNLTAIQEEPAPQDIPQSKFFLGLVNYYSNFFYQI